MKKAQVSVEFITIAGFMFLLFTGLFFAMQSRVGVMNQQQKLEYMQQLGNKVTSEVSLAESVGDGYKREFTVPVTLFGADYYVEIEDGWDLVIESEGLEYIAFLDVQVTGNLSKGTNVIQNQNGNVLLNQ